MLENRNYLIINIDELDKINFNEILETSIETMRYSLDGVKTFIKWDTNEPSFLSELDESFGPYTHFEMLEILSGPEWTSVIAEL